MARGSGRYNRTFSEEKWALVNPENKQILDDFLLEYRSQKKSPKTIEGYRQDLRIILVHIMEKHNNKSLLEMSKKDHRNVSLWLSEGMGGTSSDNQGRSNARVNRMRSALNSMMTFVEEDDSYDYDQNLSKKVKGLPKERVKTDEDDFFFSFAEFIEVRDRLIEAGDYQTAALWSVAFDSGARRSEIAQVEKAGFLDPDNHWTNVVRGKRGKKFPLIYLDDTRDIVLKWLEQRGEDDIASLWTVGNGQDRHAATSELLYSRIVKCARILSEIRGEDCEIFPHSIRHSRAECLSRGEDDRLKDENGNNRVYTLDEIRVLLHHDSVDVTQSYLKPRDNEILQGMFGF